MSTWEERGIYGFAEEWFTNNGYQWKLKKELRNKNVYTLCKDGLESDYEIWSNATNPVLYMSFVDKYFTLMKRAKGS